MRCSAKTYKMRPQQGLPTCLPLSVCVVGASDGFVVIDTTKKPEQGVMLLIWCCGRQQYAYRAGVALITDDGETIEGEALDDVHLIGVVTHTIHQVWVDDNPVM